MEPDTQEHGFGASILAGLSVSIDTLAAQTRRRNDLDERRAQAIPRDFVQPMQVTIDASGDTALVDLGSPSLGRIWQVRHIAVGGTTVTGTAAGALYVFRMGQRPSPTELPMSTAVDVAASLPSFAFYGTHQFMVNQGEHLWGAFVGCTASKQYSLTLTVEDWAVEDLAMAHPEA